MVTLLRSNFSSRLRLPTRMGNEKIIAVTFLLAGLFSAELEQMFHCLSCCCITRFSPGNKENAFERRTVSLK